MTDLHTTRRRLAMLLAMLAVAASVVLVARQARLDFLSHVETGRALSHIEALIQERRLPSAFAELAGSGLPPAERAQVHAPLMDMARTGRSPSVVGAALEAAIEREDARAAAARTRTDLIFALSFGLGMLLMGLIAWRHEVMRRRVKVARMAQVAAGRDSLTGLASRAALVDDMGWRLGEGGHGDAPLALLHVDLRDFRAVNDRFGAPTGDEALRVVATRMAAWAESRETVARLGSDEFAVLVPDVDRSEEASARAVSLQRELSAPMMLGGHEIVLEPAIGVALGRASGSTVDGLLHEAEAARLVARATYARVQVYEPEHDPLVPARITITGELRRAIERHELVLHYQPEVDMRSGRVVGVEALVRWEHPDRGLLTPDAFLSVAERSGQMWALTEEVLRMAIAAAGGWRSKGHELRVAVNISPRGLCDERLPATVAELIAASALPPTALLLEVTEDALGFGGGDAERTLHRLAELGCPIAIDDFGTGHSSLRRLGFLPLSELKIDRSFVAAMGDDSGNAAIVRSTVDLAHDLGLAVVGEGIEDVAAWRELRRLGCDLAQGWYVSRPMPAAAVPGWVSDRESSHIPERREIERKSGEQAMAETMAWFHDLFTSADFGMALLELDGRFLRVNRALRKILGHTEPELLARTVADITHPDELEDSVRVRRELLAGDVTSATVERRYLRADGTEVWGQVTLALVRDVDDQPLHFVAQVSDIGPRKAAQHDLEQLAAAVRSRADAVYTASLDGLIRSWSPGAVELFGYSEHEAVGSPLGMLGPESSGEIRAELDAVASAEVLLVQTARESKDGSLVPVELTVSPLRDERLRVVGISVLASRSAVHERV